VDEKPTVMLLEGVFYEGDDGTLMVADHKLGAVSVDDALTPLIGRKVVLVVHHKPPEPADEGRWAGGACMYEPSGECPCGHHERKGWLYTYHHAGTLDWDGSKWAVTTDQGRQEPWLASLVGHRSQIVISALPDVEKLKEDLNLGEQPTKIEDLEERITKLRDLFVAVDEMKDKL